MCYNISRCIIPAACIQILTLYFYYTTFPTTFFGLNVSAANCFCWNIHTNARRKRETHVFLPHALARGFHRSDMSRNSIKENLENYKALLQCVATLSRRSFFRSPHSTQDWRIPLGQNSNDSGHYRRRLSVLFPRIFRLRHEREKRGERKRVLSRGCLAEDNLRWPGPLRSFQALTRLIAGFWKTRPRWPREYSLPPFLALPSVATTRRVQRGRYERLIFVETDEKVVPVSSERASSFVIWQKRPEIFLFSILYISQFLQNTVRGVFCISYNYYKRLLF